MNISMSMSDYDYVKVFMLDFMSLNHQVEFLCVYASLLIKKYSDLGVYFINFSLNMYI